MKKKIKYSIIGVFLLSIIAVGVFWIVKSTRKEYLTLDGKNYYLSVKLDKYLKEFDIDYSASKLTEGSKLKADSEDDLKIILKSEKYPSGFSVVISNGTKEDLEYSDCTVECLIIDITELSNPPELSLKDGLNWGVTTEKAQELLGEPELDSPDEDYTLMRFKNNLSADINFYFNKQSELYRIMAF